MTPVTPQLQAGLETVAVPSKLPLLYGPAGPRIGQATIIRADDGTLAVVVDRLDGGTTLRSGLIDLRRRGEA